MEFRVADSISPRYSQNASLETNNLINVQNRFESLLPKREMPHPTTGPRWHGTALNPCLPLSGDNRGFAGILAPEKIRTSNAFLTGFLWFLILVSTVASVIILTNTIIAGYQLRPPKVKGSLIFRNSWSTFLTSTCEQFLSDFLWLCRFLYSFFP